MKKLRLAVLGSTRGTDLLALIAAAEQKKLQADLALVVSNKKDAGILEKARSHQIKDVFVDSQGLTREAFDKRLSAVLQAEQIDLIVLIGYMRILTSEFVQDWQNKIINVHPSLLPQFAGSMDTDVHEDVLKAGKKETGCTVHIVTEEVDAGPILLQKCCAVLPDDTAATLKARVQQLEGEALIEVINRLSS